MSRRNADYIICGQLSTVHSPNEAYQTEYLINYLNRITSEVPIDILILGWEEKPKVFEEIITKKKNISKQIFLWYPFLSDFPGFNDNHLVVNVKNQKSQGWGGYSGTGVNETFKQACPNNPHTIETSITHMERIIQKYDFDGVFIDKIRFPSMVNGMDDFLTCFCPHCIRKAKKLNVDLIRIQTILRNKQQKILTKLLEIQLTDKIWFEKFLESFPEIADFYNFRIHSINETITLINKQVRNLNKGFSLDVFSPSLAPLVGQDYGYMASISDWIKPMIYRFSNGPSSLRSEIPALIRELSGFLEVDVDEITKFITSKIQGLNSISLSSIEKMPPLKLIQRETESAVSKLQDTSIYLGLETVSIKGKLEINPKNVNEVVEIGKKAGVDGFVLSWDLLHSPLENLLTLKSLLKE